MDDENTVKETLQKKLKEKYGQQISIQFHAQAFTK